MDAFAYLKEECESVRRSLRETLRYDYGPHRSKEYFDECEARLDYVAAEIANNPAMEAQSIATHLGSLADIGTRVSLIERARLGEFSWPFSDQMRAISERLFREENLFAEDPAHRDVAPIVHVVAQGTDYQVVDDTLTGNRRILILAFPRHLKHYVLLHAIFGHELGHPAARTSKTGAIVADKVLAKLAEGPLGDEASAGEWLGRDDAPQWAKESVAAGTVPDEFGLKSWRDEIFCDLFGLRLFGPAFAAAHRTILEPLAGGKSHSGCGASTHPPYVVRRRAITSAMRLLGWHDPVIEEAGPHNDAEQAIIGYVCEDTADAWPSVMTDEQLADVLASLDELFVDAGTLVFTRPQTNVMRELLDRLTLNRPPIVQTISEAGKPKNERTPMQHALYAGWAFWFGRNQLREAQIGKFPRLKELSFLEINRLCEMALLQQKAIDLGLDHEA